MLCSQSRRKRRHPLVLLFKSFCKFTFLVTFLRIYNVLVLAKRNDKKNSENLRTYSLIFSKQNISHHTERNLQRNYCNYMYIKKN